MAANGTVSFLLSRHQQDCWLRWFHSVPIPGGLREEVQELREGVFGNLGWDGRREDVFEEEDYNASGRTDDVQRQGIRWMPQERACPRGEIGAQAPGELHDRSVKGDEADSGVDGHGRCVLKMGELFDWVVRLTPQVELVAREKGPDRNRGDCADLQPATSKRDSR